MSDQNSQSKLIQWVDLARYDITRQQSDVVARCALANGTISIESANETLIESLRRGLPGKKGTTLTPQDGLVFLEALTKEFRTPYLCASDIQFGSVLPPIAPPAG